VKKRLDHCNVPGCKQPRYGRHARCMEHQRQYWRDHASNKARIPEARRPPVYVVSINYAENKLQFLKAQVTGERELPYFEADLRRELARAAEQGYVVAKPIPYKESDLN
jgi:hypothetical protein